MEGKNDKILTSIKSKSMSVEPESDLKLFDSPKKTSRKRRSLLRKEEVQTALQILIADKKNHYENETQDDKNKNEGNNDSSVNKDDFPGTCNKMEHDTTGKGSANKKKSKNENQGLRTPKIKSCKKKSETQSVHPGVTDELSENGTAAVNVLKMEKKLDPSDKTPRSDPSDKTPRADPSDKTPRSDYSNKTPRSSRKKKAIDYSVFDETGNVLTDDVSYNTPSKPLNEDQNKIQVQSGKTSTGKRKSRQPKKLSVIGQDLSQGDSQVASLTDKTKESSASDIKESEDTPKRGRQRKKIDYSLLSDVGSQDEDEGWSKSKPDNTGALNGQLNKDFAKGSESDDTKQLTIVAGNQTSSITNRSNVPESSHEVESVKVREEKEMEGNIANDALHSATPDKIVSLDIDKTKQNSQTSGSQRKGRKPKKILNEDTEIDLQNKSVPMEESTPRTGRKRKKVDYAALDEDTDIDLQNNSVPMEESTPRTGRKRKKIDYAALDESVNPTSDEDTEVEGEETPRRRKKSKLSNSNELGIDSSTPEQSGKKTKPRSQKKVVKSPQKDSYKCSRCEENFNTEHKIKYHMAVQHQALWSKANPEGLDDRKSLNQVIKIKKHLNCPKCEKQLNFLQYYMQHVEWCGREIEYFTCPICGSDRLLLKWQSMHLAACRKLLAQREEAQKRAEALKQQAKEEKESTASGEKRKRKAATKASTMLHKLIKEKDDNLGNSDHDDADVDEDFKAEGEEAEDVEEEFEDDDEVEEDEGPGESDVSDDDVVDTSLSETTFRHRCRRIRNIEGVPYFSRYNMAFKVISDIHEKHFSKEVFLDLLPDRKDWIPLKNSGSIMYLPAQCRSINFTYSNTEEDLRSLGLYESVLAQDFPMLFTGMSVWKMAWCPTPPGKEAVQYLAVVGKVDRNSCFRKRERVACPGVIQMWDMGVRTNAKKARSLPRLVFNIVHDFGNVTDLKWCPSGCWQTRTDGSSEDTQRLGLLACSCTDSTIRIFSIPQGLNSTDGPVPTYKPSPLVTLVPHRSWNSCNLTCACLDWQTREGHSKLISGYSDGSVRVFNLTTKSPLQVMEKSPNKMILPYQTFQAHCGAVTACAWMAMSDHEVTTGGEDANTCFWNLNNTSQPMNLERSSFMPLRSTGSILSKGILTVSDDNYSLNTNKSRFLEPAALNFSIDAKERKSAMVTYTSSQSGCIWDLSFSNWVNFLASCDTRGTVVGVPMYDMCYQVDNKSFYKQRLALRLSCDSRRTVVGVPMYDMCYQVDNKSFYKQRLVLHQTKVKWKQQETSEDDKPLQCTCKHIPPERSRKLLGQSEDMLQSELGANQSNKVLQNDITDSDQSKDLLQKKSDRTDKSESLMEADCDKTNSEIKQVKPKHPSMMAIKSERCESCMLNKLKDPETYAEMVEKKYLEFTENLTDKGKVIAPSIDQAFDTYDRVFVNSLTSISWNPNRESCCWLAFGGESGLVRLVNMWEVLPEKFRAYYMTHYKNYRVKS